jgi:hypothetical protein
MRLTVCLPLAHRIDSAPVRPLGGAPSSHDSDPVDRASGHPEPPYSYDLGSSSLRGISGDGVAARGMQCQPAVRARARQAACSPPSSVSPRRSRARARLTSTSTRTSSSPARSRARLRDRCRGSGRLTSWPGCQCSASSWGAGAGPLGGPRLVAVLLALAALADLYLRLALRGALADADLAPGGPEPAVVRRRLLLLTGRILSFWYGPLDILSMSG